MPRRGDLRRRDVHLAQAEQDEPLLDRMALGALVARVGAHDELLLIERQESAGGEALEARAAAKDLAEPLSRVKQLIPSHRHTGLSNRNGRPSDGADQRL